jgi:pyruvate/2-oxoglutarate dehydrogenase complex dihydrolipoamide acyltransferase (E2) component
MRFTKTIASATVAAVLGIAGVSVAGATSTTGSSAAPTTTAPAAQKPASTTAPKANKAGRIARRRHLARQGVKLAAKTIGITPRDLVAEVRGGKTIAQVATDHGVQPQAVIDALTTAAKAKIEAAKTAGKITATRAARLDARVDRVVPKFVNTWLPKHRAAAAG